MRSLQRGSRVTITYQLEPNLDAAEFVGVLVRSTARTSPTLLSIRHIRDVASAVS